MKTDGYYSESSMDRDKKLYRLILAPETIRVVLAVKERGESEYKEIRFRKLTKWVVKKVLEIMNMENYKKLEPVRPEHDGWE